MHVDTRISARLYTGNMVEEKKYNGISWLRMQDPSREEIDSIIREYDIPPHIADELRLPSSKQRADLYEHFVFGVFHFPLPAGDELGAGRREIDFIVGRDFIITANYGDGDPLHDFSKLFEVNSLLEKREPGEHGGHIFFYIMKHLYHAIEKRIAALDAELEEMEAEIFKNHEREMVRSLSEASRVALDIGKMLAHHAELLESFIAASAELFGVGFEPYLRSLIADYDKIRMSVSSSREFLAELRETNRTLLTSKQNETMKFFTVISFVTFPLALLVSILNIESPDNPLSGNPDKFLIIVAITAIVSLVLFIIFKRKRWL